MYIDIIKDDKNEKTRVCEGCGRTLEIEQFKPLKIKNRITRRRKCMDCVKQERMTKCYEDGLELYKNDKSMRTARKYKEIARSRILPRKVLDFPLLARNEKFVRLLDYKQTWISTHGRCVVKAEDGSYKLLQGVPEPETGEVVYTLEKNVYDGEEKRWTYKECKIEACKLVIQTFIVNYDMKYNVMCWHAGNDLSDNYYKHLYPITAEQYAAIEKAYNEAGKISEKKIMRIVNEVNYKAEEWNPWYFRRSFEGVGYLGVAGVNYFAPSFIKWRNMIQRCYNAKVHKQKPYYKDIEVCEEWQNYSNLKIWYDEHDFNAAKKDLDKDLLGRGSNIYSPETCAFISHFLNTVFEERTAAKKGIEDSEGRYRVTMTILKKVYEVGTFDNKEEAEKAYDEYKREYVVELAQKSKGKVQDCVYEAMINWKREDVA